MNFLGGHTRHTSALLVSCFNGRLSLWKFAAVLKAWVTSRRMNDKVGNFRRQGCSLSTRNKSESDTMWPWVHDLSWVRYNCIFLPMECFLHDSLFQCLITFSNNKLFLISNLNFLWCNLDSYPTAVTWEKKPIPHLSTISIQEAAQRDKLSSEPPFLPWYHPGQPPWSSRIIKNMFPSTVSRLDSPGTETPHVYGATCCIASTRSKSFKTVFFCSDGISSVSFCVHFLLTHQWVPTKKSLVLFSFPSIRYLHILRRSPSVNLSSLGKTVPVFSASPHTKYIPVP